MAVEEISNLLVWSNKFDDPLDNNEYRIDGICFEGKFISSLTGEEINFKDYPLFDTTNCKDGDSLIYLQDTNTFDTASVNEKYKSLMTYPKIGIIEKCPTVNRFICSGGGSCINEKCECDPWSTGDACQCKINLVFDIFKCICFDFIPFSDVKGCIADCNGFGTCDFLSGKCHCPGFNGPMCGKSLLASFYSLKIIKVILDYKSMINYF